VRKGIVFLFLFLPWAVYAHQPKIVSSSDAEKGIAVQRPEISKAYYSRLTGSPHLYTINAKTAFPLYAGILLPGRKISYTVSFEILDGKNVIFRGDGASFAWRPFYERHGHDWYMNGPEFGREFKAVTTVPAGVYTIRVFNAGNTGLYSLAIGDTEDFPFLEIVKAAFNIIMLKLFFF
jgi:hypothetical protein